MATKIVLLVSAAIAIGIGLIGEYKLNNTLWWLVTFVAGTLYGVILVALSDVFDNDKRD